MEWAFDLELTTEELISIGKIVALWGALEHEIFCQTLKALVDEPSPLPKALHNVRLSDRLELWKANVVDKTSGDRKQVLLEQLKQITYLQDFRNALVHGMWDWTESAPAQVTATRIRNKQVIRTHFNAADLASFASALETINFKIRFPGGPEEYARAFAEKGQYVSRRALSSLLESPLKAADFSPRPDSGPHEE